MSLFTSGSGCDDGQLWAMRGIKMDTSFDSNTYDKRGHNLWLIPSGNSRGKTFHSATGATADVSLPTAPAGQHWRTSTYGGVFLSTFQAAFCLSVLPLCISGQCWSASWLAALVFLVIFYLSLGFRLDFSCHFQGLQPLSFKGKWGALAESFPASSWTPQSALRWLSPMHTHILKPPLVSHMIFLVPPFFFERHHCVVSLPFGLN